MKLGPGSVVHQASRIASRVIDGQAVVIVMDAEERVRLGDIAERVSAEYEVTPEQAMSDVLAFTDELVRLGAFEVVDP